MFIKHVMRLCVQVESSDLGQYNRKAKQLYNDYLGLLL